MSTSESPSSGIGAGPPDPPRREGSASPGPEPFVSERELLQRLLDEDAERCLQSPPDDLWERIEGQLPTAPPSTEKKIVVLRPLLALAACLVLVFFGYQGLEEATRPRPPVEEIVPVGSHGLPAETPRLRGDGPSWLQESFTNLKDPDPLVRAVAAESLGSATSHEEEVVPALVRALGDQHPDVRAAASEALGRLGPVASPALPVLRRLLQDSSEEVRDEVRGAIPLISGQPIEP